MRRFLLTMAVFMLLVTTMGYIRLANNERSRIMSSRANISAFAEDINVVKKQYTRELKQKGSAEGTFHSKREKYPFTMKAPERLETIDISGHKSSLSEADPAKAMDDQKHSPPGTVPLREVVGLDQKTPPYERMLSKTDDSYLPIDKQSMTSIENADHGKALADMGQLEASNMALKDKIRRYCKQFRKTYTKASVLQRWAYRSDDKKPRLFFSDSAKLLFCDTPKCGTTQWRNLMLILEGHIAGYEATTVDNFLLSHKYNFLWNKFNLRQAQDRAIVNEKLATYYKIMTVREPLERLVSAYRDKLERNSSYYGRISNYIHKTMTHTPRKHRQSTYYNSAIEIYVDRGAKDGLATFEEFVDYILSSHYPAGLDPHWQPYSKLCDPCNIDYDYIARMETVREDAAFITYKIGVSSDRVFNRIVGEDIQRRRNTLFRQYFESLSPEKRIAIFRYYKEQYDMFGYEYPTFIDTGDSS